jgi:hypothetical protein
MGLDQYAYVSGHKGQLVESYDDPSVTFPETLAYWRKHPNLQGWMERLWQEKESNRAEPYFGFGSEFNGVELELIWEDIDRLERDIKSGALATLNTTGFFFGSPSDDHYREQDLAFCASAKAELFLGRRVLYNSSW